MSAVRVEAPVCQTICTARASQGQSRWDCHRCRAKIWPDQGGRVRPCVPNLADAGPNWAELGKHNDRDRPNLSIPAQLGPKSGA